MIARGALAGVAMMALGCSVIAQRTAPRDPPIGERVTCEASTGKSTGDFAVALTVATVSALAFIGGAVVEWSDRDGRGVMVASAIAGPAGYAIFGFSAAYGAHHARRCRSFLGLALEE